MTVAVMVGCWLTSVKADDIFPPPWQRGTPNTTYQGWTWPTAENPAPPDEGYYNNYGVPISTVTGGSWTEFLNNHVGVWTLTNSGSLISFNIPNTTNANPVKDVWTQVTWLGGVSNETPVVSVVVNGHQYASSLVESQTEGTGSWIDSAYETVLPFNPTNEIVDVTGSLPGLNVGEVVIDTQCIPEPSSLALLALGSLSLLPYASRKRRLAA